MQVWCVGAGSIGMLFAAKLALAGLSVTLVTRSKEQAEAINRQGIQLQEETRMHQVTLLARVYDELHAESGQEAAASPDWIFLTVKQQHLTEAVLDQVGHWCMGGARLLCFQNGIGHVERLLAYVPSTQLDTAVTTEGARRDSYNEITHTGHGITRIGFAVEPINREQTNKAVFKQKKLIQALIEAGFESSLSNNMKEIAWNKLLMNAVINPLTALLQFRNGQLLESESLVPLMRALYDEGVFAARSHGIGIQDDLWEQLLEVCRRTANNVSSMLQDLTAGRTTEIDWLNGALLKAAQEHAVPMPANETIYRLIKALEKRGQR
jgi:2-dehydropantoate 2-reductase